MSNKFLTATGAVPLDLFRIQNCSLSQANVDAILLDVYSASFTNAAPYLFVNDPDADGVNTWTVTFNAGAGRAAWSESLDFYGKVFLIVAIALWWGFVGSNLRK